MMLGLGAGVAGASENFTPGTSVQPLKELANGEYVWTPETSPTGPVVLIISIPKQQVYVYRNGVRIAQSTVSTGKPGHRTPAGVFTILEKQKDHTSSIYKGASMPYMQRLTWDGVCMHAGILPGYANSHGCVRLPYDFAKKLYTVTGKGCTVIVTDSGRPPKETEHPSYLLTANTGGKAGRKLASEDFRWNPEEAPSGPISIIFSAKSQSVFVFRNGIEIGRAHVHGIDSIPDGIQAYTALDRIDADGWRDWMAVTAEGDSTEPQFKNLARRLQIPPDFLADVRSVIQPGTTLVLTDIAITPSLYEATKGLEILRADER